MDMGMRRYKHRKMDGRTVKRIVRETIVKDPFKLRTQVNTENVLLLLADPDLAIWARQVRIKNGIPEEGFKSGKQVGKWQQKTRDEELFDRSLAEAYLLYTKINSQYMPYIRAFVLHDNDFQNHAVKPMSSYEIGRSEFFFEEHKTGVSKPPKSKKIPQLRVDIYHPLTAEQWEQVMKEASEYFEDFGISSGSKAPMPLGDKVKLKLIALKTLGKRASKPTKSGLITDTETTRQIIVDAYPDISETDIKKLLNNLPQERKRAKVLLATRLGKTGVNITDTKH
jgi:hypothetical protein